MKSRIYVVLVALLCASPISGCTAQESNKPREGVEAVLILENATARVGDFSMREWAQDWSYDTKKHSFETDNVLVEEGHTLEVPRVLEWSRIKNSASSSQESLTVPATKTVTLDQQCIGRVVLAPFNGEEALRLGLEGFITDKKEYLRQQHLETDVRAELVHDHKTALAQAGQRIEFRLANVLVSEITQRKYLDGLSYSLVGEEDIVCETKAAEQRCYKKLELRVTAQNKPRFDKVLGRLFAACGEAKRSRRF